MSSEKTNTWYMGGRLFRPERNRYPKNEHSNIYDMTCNQNIARILDIDIELEDFQFKSGKINHKLMTYLDLLGQPGHKEETERYKEEIQNLAKKFNQLQNRITELMAESMQLHEQVVQDRCADRSNVKEFFVSEPNNEEPNRRKWFWRSD